MSEQAFKACGEYFSTREEAEAFAVENVEEATTRDDIKAALVNVAMGSFSGGNLMDRIEAATDKLFAKFDITYKKAT